MLLEVIVELLRTQYDTVYSQYAVVVGAFSVCNRAVDTDIGVIATRSDISRWECEVASVDGVNA